MTRPERWAAPDAVAIAEAEGEATRLTEAAHAWALRTAEQQIGQPVLSAKLGASLRLLLPPGYVAEVRGQESFLAHGKTGTHPDRLGALLDLGMPVLVVFVEWERVDFEWLHRVPPYSYISKRLSHPRIGWFVRDLQHATRDTFVFPSEVPGGDGSLTIPQQLFTT